MNRTLNRPMFRIGGSAGTGITSGLDRKPLKQGTDPQDRTFKPDINQALDVAELSKDPRVRDVLFPSSGGLSPGTLPGFLTQFGLNLTSQTPTGNIFQTAAIAAQDPFKTFQAAKLARTDDRAKFARDLFSGDIASQYDLEAQRIKNLKEGTDGRKTAEVEADIIRNAQTKIFEARDVLKDENSTADQKLNANRTIKINQNILQKELGVPIEYSVIVSTPELFDPEMTAIVQKYNDTQLKKMEEYAINNPDVDEQTIKDMFPLMVDGSVEARMLTIEELRERFGFASGGRAGYAFGTKPEPKMMESVVEQKKQTGEVQDLSYTELRARLPQEISNDIVMLLANSKQALLDFANIQTTEDIASFNQQYDVNLSMPSGA